MSEATTALRKAIRLAYKRLPFAPERKQEEALSYTAGSLAEAYRIGAEEAQTEIAARLTNLYATYQGKR